MSNQFSMRPLVLGTIALAFACGAAVAQDKVLNIYSARHYQTDDAMYDTFTRTTGIRINRVDSDDAGLLTRLKTEGAASPADVVLLVDAARLARAESDGLFKPIRSTVLEERIPAKFRAAPSAEGTAWYGFSTRARVVVYDKLKVKKDDVDTYEELGDPKNKGKLCTRSGSHPYNISLFATMIEHVGDAKAETWLKGMVDNMARPPKGGDTDQIRAVASGECAIAVTNTYYLARLLKSTKPEDRAVTEKIGVVFPNQGSWGTHLNIAGGAVARHTKNPQAAVAFLEFLSSEYAQNHFANGNNEWPTVKGLAVENAALKAMGGDTFKSETIPLSVVSRNLTRTQQMLDRVGYR